MEFLYRNPTVQLNSASRVRRQTSTHSSYASTVMSEVAKSQWNVHILCTAPSSNDGRLLQIWSAIADKRTMCLINAIRGTIHTFWKKLELSFRDTYWLTTMLRSIAPLREWMKKVEMTSNLFRGQQRVSIALKMFGHKNSAREEEVCVSGLE